VEEKEVKVELSFIVVLVPDTLFYLSSFTTLWLPNFEYIKATA
jgi:hypothetical protein